MHMCIHRLAAGSDEKEPSDALSVQDALVHSSQGFPRHRNGMTPFPLRDVRRRSILPSFVRNPGAYASACAFTVVYADADSDVQRTRSMRCF